ncbi:hypothetical protein FEM48_Zijuj01G0103400 [Ziziphus jujuba var. spinosa]|uniref:Uncharacterized protein n=1 Tax=Ziziphus jujuba var. spinosa TaxID=714518 RepID=A0A978W0P5_ZIZJJ|nr:hypothetical protein FEM48_Zijuj01G0103400 [Ziziphus jujuba var. spinosa]
MELEGQRAMAMQQLEQGVHMVSQKTENLHTKEPSDPYAIDIKDDRLLEDGRLWNTDHGVIRILRIGNVRSVSIWNDIWAIGAAGFV